MRHKSYWIILGFVLGTLNLFSQSVSRQVFGAGGFSTTPFRSFIKIECNIGEPLITTIGDNNAFITQGFIQPSVPLIFPPPFDGIKFSITPNPASRFIFIHADKELTADIRVLDMNNRLLRTYHNIKLGNGFFMDISSLIPGTYLVIISNNDGTITQKFIKQ